MSGQTFIAACWEYAQQALPALPQSTWTDGKVLDCIDSLYPGGLSAFRAAHAPTDPEPSCGDSRGRFSTGAGIPHIDPPHAPAANLGTPAAHSGIATVPTSPLTLRAMAEGLVGRRLVHTVFDEVVDMYVSDDALTIIVRVHEVQELRASDRIRATALRKLTYLRPSESSSWRWVKPVVDEIWVDDDQEFIASYVTPMTEERYLDKAEQIQLCYRPGSSRTPMDGFAVREAQDSHLVTLWNKKVITKWTPFD